MTVPSERPAAPAMRLLCPAKINLHLRVGPRRDDGFHSLLSWMCTVGLFDMLTLERPGLERPAGGSNDAGSPGADLSIARATGPSTAAEVALSAGGKPPERRAAPPGETGKLVGAAAVRSGAVAQPVPGVRLALECEPAGLPCDERNLVVRVTAAWRVSPDRSTTLRARLDKRIPVGAGLGGGSSDAARMILALQRLYPGGAGATDSQPPASPAAFAARFGSDVPFFLAGPSSACAGRGEIIRPIAEPRPRWALLVLPDLMMPTPAVYRQFDAMGLGRTRDIEREPDWAHWASLDAAALLPELVNDLEPPAFALSPELDALRRRLESKLGRPVRMSGSGSSLFTLYDGGAEARAAVEQLNRDGAPAGALAARFEAVELTPTLQDDLAAPAGPVA